MPVPKLAESRQWGDSCPSQTLLFAVIHRCKHALIWILAAQHEQLGGQLKAAQRSTLAGARTKPSDDEIHTIIVKNFYSHYYTWYPERR